MSGTQRVRRLIGQVLEGVASGQGGAEVPSQTHLSRYQLSRLFKQATGETPAEFRKRLLLERAAYQLGHSPKSITDIALDAGYQALEAFTRAFRRAFGASPSHYRRLGNTAFFLSAPNNIHFMPKGQADMDLLDLMLEHDFWLTRKILERAKNLTPAQLDSDLGPSNPISFEHPQRSLREMLDRLILWKEVWLSGLRGSAYTPDPERTPESFRRRLEAVYPEFIALAREVRDQGRFGVSFVDYGCEPPERFTFGGMIAHVLTFSAHQRALILEALRGFGIHDLGYGDPIDFTRLLETQGASS